MKIITIYSKPGCPYCDKAKSFLTDLNLEYNEIRFDPTLDNYTQLRDDLFTKFNHKSYPIITIGNTFIGGYTELINLYESLTLHNIIRTELDIELSIVDDDF